jgi:hypothetical protein
MNRGLSMGYTAYIVLSPIGTLPRKVEPPIGDDEDADLEDFKFTRKVGKNTAISKNIIAGLVISAGVGLSALQAHSAHQDHYVNFVRGLPAGEPIPFWWTVHKNLYTQTFNHSGILAAFQSIDKFINGGQLKEAVGSSVGSWYLGIMIDRSEPEARQVFNAVLEHANANPEKSVFYMNTVLPTVFQDRTALLAEFQKERQGQ